MAPKGILLCKTTTLGKPESKMQSSEGRSSGVSSEKETFQGSPLEERSGQTMKHLLICLFRDDAGTGVPSSPRKQTINS